MRKIKKFSLTILVFSGLLTLLAFTGNQAPAVSALPAPPHGYHLTYSHDFATQGWGDWSITSQNGATEAVTSQGLGSTLTATMQNVGASSAFAFKPGSFIQGYVYLDPINGVIANWPAFWSVGPNWPYGGEIDFVEGLGGSACWHTHYPNDPNPGGCAPAGQFTGWHVFSALWTHGKVTFWYDSQQVGTEPLTTDKNLQLEFGSTSNDFGCSICLGPPKYPSTVYLQWVKVWHK